MKPLADHGTTARAKGRPASGIKGCPCTPCRQAEARYDKRRRYLNATGRTLTVDPRPVADHIRNLFAEGAGWNQLVAASGCSNSTISLILNGKISRIHRTTADKLLAVQPGDAQPPGLRVPTTGSVRRLHALLAIGHTCKAISAASGVEHSTLSDLINERLERVARHVTERVASGYSILAGTRGNSARSINRGLRNNWAPPAAWDDDHLDDPDAHPNWTGHCGTDRGYHLHVTAQLAKCQPCIDAHQQWIADHPDLKGLQLRTAITRARGKAASREFALAENARELLRFGYNHHHAAERLGSTETAIYQAMKRHPEAGAIRLEAAA
ncbi:helix-turn-helix domain-containing protein [Streptomyces nigrescens]|uniref:Helix-turn-helix transcriptional regulator n=1 Tax=Streptomyces nigrescens TaxID=1920 RepID=A0A640T8R4_STRNI|nr:helix-turn-helix transcriptional regulator [Streptomyces libani]WAT94971.1 helix-turn-helix transcriptional regulator [Streptomyces libani subsp. libani]GFE20129.1 hypothetical protein Sliba_05820 [Streptomyces libani subsp. libani]GGV85949.1 hypothetical protein GCM10010500_03260 [Streptomyces libani subsp. libani]